MPLKEQPHSHDKAVSKHQPSKPAAENSNMPAKEQGDPAAIIQRAMSGPGSLTPRDVLRLQRTIGNRAVNRLLARSGSRPPIQASLKVGAAGDRYEQEADRVADQVLRMPMPAGEQRPAGSDTPDAQRQEDEAPQAKPLAASITPLVQRHAGEGEEIPDKLLAQRHAEEEEVQAKPLAQRHAEEGEEVQAKPGPLPSTSDRPDGFETGSEIESRLAASRGGGSSLPDEMRSALEPRFGADFSRVRLHTGGEAAQLSRDLGAQAFTHGPDIYLGAGRYSPGTPEGQRLLAHELTHVVQQGAAQVRRSGDASPALHGEPGLQRTCGDRAQHVLPGPANCHEFVLWKVLQEDFGLSKTQATDALADLRLPGTAPGSSINAAWYGPHLTNAGAQVDEVTIRNAAVGDIIVTSALQNPMHSMLVAKQNARGTWIRGFNNFGTLLTGVGNQDDPHERNLHGSLPASVGGQLPNGAKADSYWKPNGEFWSGPIFVVPRGTFRTNLQAVSGRNPQPRRGWCYITTACVQARGLADDCEELTVLRAFRDDYLLKKANGRQLVGLYYRHAPRIVRAIARQKHASAIYDQLYEVICACVAAIQRGDPEFAYATYCRMVTDLTQRYIPDAVVPVW